ncbi:epithelial cell-transforming sequence 2 oncogene-like isoform X3 [Canis lupus familiaris]|uniref:epithelial cell-transforming sequence 2 oncogene-like isoform X3 n=1 Tax=Canis lupus familiaris TaxID=9615 RepID=UPI0018F38B9A|nr:epithelial cell-transforming sequence 2 oncogene-like isoform X3 [Canis lupus familiaris]XP_038510199.1 epithelial cell-transforming sequence 2 oncogene-like isoform X3 [Canis lupus familiaris]
MSAGDSSRKTLEMECFHTRFSAWTPFSNKSLNRQLFQERVALISHWFDLWTNKQRQEFLFTIFLRCSKSQLRCVQDFSERMQVAKLDFSTVLPRFISLYIFSFLNPKDLCAAAQVSWPWKFLTEQDCLWMSKCIRFGWFLPYTPADNEYGAWKHHYIACVSNLDWLTPREAAAIYGTLNEPKTKYEELQEKQREKCLRKLIWEKSALRKKELFKVRPPWVSGTCCSRLLKSKCQPRLSQALKDLRDRGGLHEALEKQLVLASLEALPKQNNLSGSHSYPLLSKKTWHGVHKNDDSSSHASQPHFLLISSRIPAYEIVVASIRTGIISVVYEHSSLTLDSLLYLIEKALDGQKVQSMGIFSDGDSREINLLQGYKIGIKNLLRPEVRDFWEKLGSYVAPEEEGGHVDLFVPLGASEAGIQVLSQLSQLTGTFFTAPTGIATGSYQHILSDWLGRPERAPCSIYFSESKLYTWSRVTDFLEDTLKSVRKQLSPLFKELQKNISARIIGQFTFDNMNMANILDNQEISQALADGLMELSKDNSDKPLEFLSDFLLKKCGKGSQDLEENVIPTKCDPKAAFSLLPKERNVIEDSPQDTKSSLSKNDPNLEMLVKLCREMIPAFCAFLKRHDKTIATKMLSLAELLLYPSRRFEEYINLLYALRLHTPAEHVDRGDLTTAIDQIKKYKSYIDQMKQNIRMKDQLPDIQRIVRGCPPLSEENRYLIRVQDVAQLHCCDEAVSFPLRQIYCNEFPQFLRVFISLSLLKNNFAGYRIVFSFNILLSSCLPGF